MNYSKRMSPGMDEIAFGTMLDKSILTLKRVKNFNVTRFELDPDTPDSHPESTASLKNLMKQGPPQGGQWDAHLIGAGVRRMPQIVELFEEITNSIIATSGGRARVLFLQKGDDHLECVRRVLPELEVEKE